MSRKIGLDTVDYEPVELLVDTGGSDRPAMLVALLALAYGLPLASILAARWQQFDLSAKVWRLPSGEVLPLTPPMMQVMRLHLLHLNLLRVHLLTSGRLPDSLLFAGRDGGQWNQREVESRVRRLMRGRFTLSDLREVVLSRYTYFETAHVRIEARVIEMTARCEDPKRIDSFRHNTSTFLRRRLHEWHEAIRLDKLLRGYDSDRK
ncbi:MAG TPA: hypothetical protein VJS90_18940 [Pseudomonas sp.]|uniref:hypothetical protein n=1 Tax=Pseudomonas sp. TaxID=306 RepID=UPI002B45DEA6|nr:hypothetical protein [Pseudomonas sp.]HKS15113.1 hypothetical protein [Pseudomonas sp.]